LAFVFHKLDLKWMAGIIAVRSAVTSYSECFIGFPMGQPRIWMSMSRDGLLPKKFSRVHQFENTFLRYN
jgi:amino acid transporter